MQNLFKCLGAPHSSDEQFFKGLRTLTEEGYELGYPEFPLKSKSKRDPAEEPILLYSPEFITFTVPISSLADPGRIHRQEEIQMAAHALYGKLEAEGAENTVHPSGEAFASSIASLKQYAEKSGFGGEWSVKEAARLLHETRERVPQAGRLHQVVPKIGRASCRERVCQYV